MKYFIGIEDEHGYEKRFVVETKTDNWSEIENKAKNMIIQLGEEYADIFDEYDALIGNVEVE